jgi:mono/diheme cytochrome c family protein
MLPGTLPVQALILAVLAGSPLVAAQSSSATPDPQAASNGRGTFRTYCATCHGLEARGDGQLAEHLKVKPANLTEITKRNEGGEFPFDLVVQIIDGRQKVKGHGGGEMPVWGDAFRVTESGHTEEQVQARIGNLAHFLWSIQRP